MSMALDLYLSVADDFIFRENEYQQAWSTLVAAASEWRRHENYYAAAYSLHRALPAVWTDSARWNETAQLCIADCRSCIGSRSLDSLEALASIRLWLSLLSYYGESRQIREELCEEYVSRCLAFFAEGELGVGFLVRGMQILGNLDGGWEPVLPSDTESAHRLYQFGGGNMTTSLPSVFDLYRMLGNYEGLQELARRFPDEFDSRPLQGWKYAIEAANATLGKAALYARAADAFAQDVCPPPHELSNRPAGWSGENVNVWAKHFRARAALARIPETRAQAKALVAEAITALAGTQQGLVKEEVYRLGIIVNALGSLVGAENARPVEECMADLRTAQWIFGENQNDAETQRFLSCADTAMQAFISDPVDALASGTIAELLEMLSRMPAIGADIATGVKRAIGEHSHALLRGIDYSWVHRTLAGIKVERTLQHIFLRLAQTTLPQYAQVLHGPLEYGKDVVVLVEENGRRILRMYQLKCGDLDMSGWRDVQPQLSEMFLVELNTINIDMPIDERVGILVANGHAKPNVDPVMRAWFDRELDMHGCKYEFMHLDQWANWIVHGRLYNTFRAALREAGVATL